MSVVSIPLAILQWGYPSNPIERFFWDDGYLPQRLALLALGIVLVVLFIRAATLLEQNPPAPRPPASSPAPAAAAAAKPAPRSSTWWMSKEERLAAEAEQLAAEIDRLDKEAERTRKATELIMARADYDEAVKATTPQAVPTQPAPQPHVAALTHREIIQLFELANLPADHRERLLALVSARIEEKGT